MEWAGDVEGCAACSGQPRRLGLSKVKRGAGAFSRSRGQALEIIEVVRN
jgi:hypothetical protein